EAASYGVHSQNPGLRGPLFRPASGGSHLALPLAQHRVSAANRHVLGPHHDRLVPARHRRGIRRPRPHHRAARIRKGAGADGGRPFVGGHGGKARAAHLEQWIGLCISWPQSWEGPFTAPVKTGPRGTMWTARAGGSTRCPHRERAQWRALRGISPPCTPPTDTTTNKIRLIS